MPIGLVECLCENCANCAICTSLLCEGQFSDQAVSYMSSTSEVLSVSSLIWSVPFDFRQWVCAISCMNCICCVVTVRSITLARASTLTCEKVTTAARLSESSHVCFGDHHKSLMESSAQKAIAIRLCSEGCCGLKLMCSMRETTELPHYWCELRRRVPPGHCGCYFPPTQYVLPEQVKIEKPTTGTLPWRLEHISAISLG